MSASLFIVRSVSISTYEFYSMYVCVKCMSWMFIYETSESVCILGFVCWEIIYVCVCGCSCLFERCVYVYICDLEELVYICIYIYIIYRPVKSYQYKYAYKIV